MFSDGDVVGAALDRNGLRPARYMLTADAEGKVGVSYHAAELCWSPCHFICCDLRILKMKKRIYAKICHMLLFDLLCGICNFICDLLCDSLNLLCDTHNKFVTASVTFAIFCDCSVTHVTEGNDACDV